MPPAVVAQPAATPIKWETSQSDYTSKPRSGARFIVIAAILSGLVILGLLLWAIVH
jgi:hypothetical protein